MIFHLIIQYTFKIHHNCFITNFIVILIILFNQFLILITIKFNLQYLYRFIINHQYYHIQQNLFHLTIIRLNYIINLFLYQYFLRLRCNFINFSFFVIMKTINLINFKDYLLIISILSALLYFVFIKFIFPTVYYLYLFLCYLCYNFNFSLFNFLDNQFYFVRINFPYLIFYFFKSKHVFIPL